MDDAIPVPLEFGAKLGLWFWMPTTAGALVVRSVRS
jgi:hypothetical protein